MGNSFSELPPTPTTKPDVEACKYGQYCSLRFLSKGSFGKVIVAFREDDPQRTEYTLKVIPLERANRTEVQVLKDIQDIAGVVRYVEHFETRDDLVIVTEYYEGIELFEYLVNRGAIPEVKAREVFRQLCTTMASVHKRGITHRDLKPENILVTNQYQVIILDWGMAFYPARTDERKSCGSPNYAAPEVLDQEPKYNGPEVDTWSLGVILYAILTASLPFNSDYIPELFRSIRNCEVNYNRRGISEDAAALLETIFVRKDRVTLSTILRGEWLNPSHGWYGTDDLHVE